MSKLYINDLESIKNGKIVRLNFGYKDDFNRELTLTRLNSQINDLRYIRNFILNTFKNDVKVEFDKLIGNHIEEHRNIDFDPEWLFLSKYLLLTVPTIMGDTTCLVSESGLESATFESKELEEKINLIFPYIKGILNVKENSNILDNEFYTDTNIYNDNFEKTLVINGSGIFLPFRDYFDLDESEKQDLLNYYYSNWDKILKYINIPESKRLDIYRTYISKEKALKLYKGLE